LANFAVHFPFYMRTDIKVFVVLTLSMVFWAFSFVWIKIAYEVFLPLTTVLLRLVLSSAILFAVFGWMRKLQPIAKGDHKWFLLLAFFEPFMYFMGESFGLQVVSSTLGAVIVSTIPLLTPITAWLFLRERLSVFNVVGILVSFVGVSVMVVGKNMTLQAPAYGIALMFMAVSAALGYAIVLKRLTARYNPFTLITYQNFIGIFMFLPFFLAFEWQSFLTVEVTLRAVGAILQLTVFASSLAFIFFTYGVTHIGVSRANVFTNTIPVFTAIFAWWLLDEPLTANKWAGISIVILGLFVAQFKRNRYVV
jgi:drug/metabolite transporter (DMT)-like permease